MEKLLTKIANKEISRSLATLTAQVLHADRVRLKEMMSDSHA